MSDTTVIRLKNVARRLKTTHHGVSRDFQLFLYGAVIKLDVFNDLIFDLSLLHYPCF